MGVTEFVFQLQALKAKIKGVLNRPYCCYGKRMTITCLQMIENLYDTIIVASLVFILQNIAVRKVLETVTSLLKR